MSKTKGSARGRAGKKTSARPKSRERAEQQQYVKWLRKQSMHHPACVAAYSTPNAGKRSYRQAMVLRTEGMIPGVPDFVVPAPSPDRRYGALYLEFKAPPDPVTGKGAGRLSEKQKFVINELRLAGNRVEVVDSAVIASEITAEYLGHPAIKPLDGVAK